MPTDFALRGSFPHRRGKKHMVDSSTSSAAGQNIPMWHTPMARGRRKYTAPKRHSAPRMGKIIDDSPKYGWQCAA